MANPNGGPGRNPKYKKEYDELAFKFCLLGATDVRLADLFGVSEATINNWKLAHPTFLESLRRGKEVADAEVAEALFNKAKGYDYTEECSTKMGVIELRKKAHPDTAAAIIWLKNRAHWSDKQQLQHTTIDQDGKETGFNFVEPPAYAVTDTEET